MYKACYLHDYGVIDIIVSEFWSVSWYSWLYFFIIIIIIIIIELSLGGSNPYTSTDKTNKNKYT